MKKIAIIEDDPGLNAGIVLALKSQQFQFSQYYSLEEAKEVLKPPFPDLILLDINLPDGNGLDFLQKNPFPRLCSGDHHHGQRPGNVPGNRSGAGSGRLHCQALQPHGSSGQDFQRPEKERLRPHVFLRRFSFDFENMQFYRKGQRLELSKTEQRLLRLLVEHRGMVVSREFLTDRIWTDSAEYVDENALSVTIKRLRDKLEEQPSAPRYIHTVYRQGYIWKEEET